MASSSGSSSQVVTSPSDIVDLRAAASATIDLRKERRMISNRESARRSRMRKQKHLDNLSSQVNQLRKENSEISSTLSLTLQNCRVVEAESFVFRAQIEELRSRLHSLNQIIRAMNAKCSTACLNEQDYFSEMIDEFLCNQQPMMAMESFQYC